MLLWYLIIMLWGWGVGQCVGLYYVRQLPRGFWISEITSGAFHAILLLRSD